MTLYKIQVSMVGIPVTATIGYARLRSGQLARLAVLLVFSSVGPASAARGVVIGQNDIEGPVKVHAVEADDAADDLTTPHVLFSGGLACDLQGGSSGDCCKNVLHLKIIII